MPPNDQHDPGPSSSAISTHKVEAALQRSIERNLTYGRSLREIETRLTHDLAAFRQVEDLMRKSFDGVQRNHQRADKLLNYQVPQIRQELEDLHETLTDLSDTLPTIQTQVADIRHAYDSGHVKAQELVADLTWLNTDFYERWRLVVFTSSSPVSWRWKVYMRSLFVISFILCSWLSWIAITGAYRAHRHRLVWGEKLMS